MDFPLTLTFKLFAINPQVAVTDADGRLFLYVRQKVFKLRERVTVFADRERTLPVYEIAADRVIDFRATYEFDDAEGRRLGAMRGEGVRSIWRARYTVLDEQDEEEFHIREENPWVKVLDGFLSEVPVVGGFAGYFLHPTFAVERPDGTAAFRLRKQASFLERRFELARLAPVEPAEAERALLGLLMMVLLERRRG